MNQNLSTSMPIQKLKENAAIILNQIANLVEQISDNNYAEQLDLLNNNTISKHVRHIVELYVQLLAGIPNNEINYDKRERNLLIESNRLYTLNFINDLQKNILLVEEKEQLIVLNSLINDEEILVKTSIERELIYNIEHAIHHMAIIQIAVNHYFKYISLDKNFGIAYATIKHKETCAQ